MGMISDNLYHVKAMIRQACDEFGRAHDSVQLLAVSKTFPPEAIVQAYHAGQRAFGENYIQEAVEKVLLLADLPGLQWHMIGPIQSNKTRWVAQHFHWAHSVDRLKIAQRLSEQRPVDMPPLQLCLQVNIDGGVTKSGVLPEEAAQMASAIAALPHVTLRGIMVIPEPAPDFEAACQVFAKAHSLFEQIRTQHATVDTLSMGMSGDMRAAIAQGSTLVRVGTAIFGQRHL
jgi:PLP dependent protein